MPRKGGPGLSPEKILKLYIKVPAFWALVRVLEASEEGVRAHFAASESYTGMCLVVATASKLH